MTTAFIALTSSSTVTRQWSCVCSAGQPAENGIASETRRTLMKTAVPLIGGLLSAGVDVAWARQKPSKSLELALVPIIRVEESCQDLLTGLDDGTYEGSYREIKNIITTMLKGNDLKENIKQISLNVDPKKSTEIIDHGRSAMEYLSSAISYFNPVDLENKPTSTFVTFVQKALKAVKKELDVILKAMPPESVTIAKQTLHGFDEPAEEEAGAGVVETAGVRTNLVE